MLTWCLGKPSWLFLYSQHAASVLEHSNSRNHIAQHQILVACSNQLLRLLHHIGRAADRNVH